MAAKMIQVFVVTNGNRNAKYEYNPQSRYQYATFPKATADTTELIHYALPLTEKLYQPGLKYLKAGVILSESMGYSLLYLQPLFHVYLL